ncbi:MAG: ATP-binding cassette domain-containing protein [Planctomycetes bacterium]|nr:ATP-binding cassette domain-containing protein [Planctomycetota bacterium]MBI3834181.1 ATP-binding cassette domain-containing protein [Planctomycetota bacterium]
MIRVGNLTKRYGSLVAVDDLSFEVERGGVLGFLGPNGAGKTTTIRILSCYHPASSGSASIAGFDCYSQSMEVRRRVGYLPESTPLYPEMRVREYLNFRGKLRGMGWGERSAAIKRVTDRCWLTAFVDRPIGQLSKGMRQRVGLADAIMHEPQVLILDEPTIGLDPTQIRETRNLIKELGEHHTVMLSSHILHEVEQTCDRAIIIASGRIVASGSMQELRNRFSTQGGRVIAEVRASQNEVESGAKTLDGIEALDVAASNGWVRLAVKTLGDRDIREDLFKLSTSRGWTLRELRREGANLEDFFIQVTAEQAQKAKQRSSINA